MTGMRRDLSRKSGLCREKRFVAITVERGVERYEGYDVLFLVRRFHVEVMRNRALDSSSSFDAAIVHR